MSHSNCKGCTKINPSSDERCILAVVDDFNGTGEPGHFGSCAFMGQNGSLRDAGDGRPVAEWAWCLSSQFVTCRCGRPLSPAPSVCRCGRDHRERVHIPTLLARVDGLEQRLEALEKKLDPDTIAERVRESLRATGGGT